MVGGGYHFCMKKLIPFFSLILFVFLFTGCPPESDPAPVEQEKETISFWHIDGYDNQMAAWRKIADNFEKANPDVKIEITVYENNEFKEKIAEMMAAGKDLPDIFRSWGGGVMIEQAEAGKLKDIGPAVLSGAFGQSSHGAMTAYAYNGKQYGAPYSMGIIGLWYNKAVFDAKGLTEADFDTWEKFLTSCATLKDANITPIALGGAETWTEHYWWTYPSQRIGGEQAFMNAYNGTGAFNTGAFLTGMELVKELSVAGWFQENYRDYGQQDASVLVADGRAAMTLMGQWTPSTGRGNATTEEGGEAEFGLMMFPTISGGVDNIKNVQGGGDGYVIGKNAPAKTVDFLMSMFKPENYKIIVEELEACPVLAGFDNLISPELAEVSAAVRNADYFQLYYDQFFPYEMGEVIKEATDLALKTDISAQEACDMIQNKWVEIR